MVEFIFMLTRDDTTVDNALDIYDAVRDLDLHHVGFKDVGASPEVLRQVCRRIQEDGRRAYLEVVSVSAHDELRSILAAIDIGVDVVMGGTHADEALPLLRGSGVRYFPFAGPVYGHPSLLGGTTDEIAASAADLTRRPGVDGIDLLAYRHSEPVAPIIDAVVQASSGPVVVAGSITCERQITDLARHGAWGFTIGGAIFDHVLPAGATLRDQAAWALRAAQRATRADRT